MENPNSLNNSTESKESSFTKVFLVFFDNGLFYKEHRVTLRKIYFSEEKARQFVEQMNEELQKGPNLPSREEFDLMNMGFSYEDYVEYLRDRHTILSSGKYFYYEHEVE